MLIDANWEVDAGVCTAVVATKSYSLNSKQFCCLLKIFAKVMLGDEKLMSWTFFSYLQ